MSRSSSKRQSLNGENSSADAIKVVCRFRPVKKGLGYTSNNDNDLVNLPFHKIDAETNSVEISVGDFGEKKFFSFDKIFGSEVEQREIFGEVEGVVDAVMAGFNGTILAYGQTAAGKSFTMEGPSLFDSNSQGVISRSIDKLFTLITQAEADLEFRIHVSYLEIYCEKLRDLLNPAQDNMKIRENKGEGFVVQDNTEVYCTDRQGVYAVLEAGKTNRITAPTLMNAESSRSHSILSVTVHQKHTISGRNRKGRLFLVDLAGSEKVSKTGATGTRLEEAKNINGSLTTLGMVINALCDGSPHVPYRDSKLTRLLMDALGGNSKTALIICCAPECTSISETMSTLRFGERAKTIKNKARVNEELSADELKHLLSEAKREIVALKHQLFCLQPIEDAVTSASTGTVSGADGGVSDLLLTAAMEREKELLEEVNTAKEGASRLSAQMTMLQDDVDDSRTKYEQEHLTRMQLQQELDAFKDAYRELEDRLIKVTLESKKMSLSSISIGTEDGILDGASVVKRLHQQQQRQRSNSNCSSNVNISSHNISVSNLTSKMNALEADLNSNGTLTGDGSDSDGSSSTVIKSTNSSFANRNRDRANSTGSNSNSASNLRINTATSVSSASIMDALNAEEHHDEEEVHQQEEEAVNFPPTVGAYIAADNGDDNDLVNIASSSSNIIAHNNILNDVDIDSEGSEFSEESSGNEEDNENDMESPSDDVFLVDKGIDRQALKASTVSGAVGSKGIIVKAKVGGKQGVDYQRKYIKLRDDYDQHVQRLMSRLNEEQNMRTNLSERLDEIMTRQAIREAELEKVPTPTGILSFFYHNNHNNATAKKATGKSNANASAPPHNNAQSFSWTSREYMLEQSLDEAKSDINDIIADFNATKEAHNIVVEAKDTVMRQLIKRNSDLTTERDDMMRSIDELKQNVETLTSLLRSHQASPDGSGHGSIISSGSKGKERRSNSIYGGGGSMILANMAVSPPPTDNVDDSNSTDRTDK